MCFGVTKLLIESLLLLCQVTFWRQRNVISQFLYHFAYSVLFDCVTLYTGMLGLGLKAKIFGLGLGLEAYGLGLGRACFQGQSGHDLLIFVRKGGVCKKSLGRDIHSYDRLLVVYLMLTGIQKLERRLECFVQELVLVCS